MDDNYVPYDSSVPQSGQASPDQLAALRKQYGSSTPNKTDSSGRITTGTPTKKEIPIFGKEAAVKAFQSATFGGGADLVRLFTGKQNEHTIRQIAYDYDDQHPLAGFGIDLVTAGTMSFIPGIGGAKDVETLTKGAELAAKMAKASKLKAYGKAALGGAAYGGLTGVFGGGDLGTRAEHGVENAALGGVLGPTLSYAGKAARPLLEKMGLASAEKGAAQKILSAINKSGKTPAEFDAFIKKNPNGRLADFSEHVSDVVAKAGGLTQNTARAISKIADADRESQIRRIYSGAEAATPLDKTKEEMFQNIDKLRTQKNAAYKLSKTEEQGVSPELRNTLNHPAVKPIVENAIKDYGQAKAIGVHDILESPKPHFKGDTLERIPSALLDDIQIELRKAANAQETSTTLKGTLNAALDAIKSHQEGTIKDAQSLASRLGGEHLINGEPTGIIGAQKWGQDYAFGTKDADINVFRKFTPEQKEYAKLGMLMGLEEYLYKHNRMAPGALNGIADGLKNPKITEVLGKKAANDARKVFVRESARAKVTANIEKGGSRVAAFNAENQKRSLSHGANVLVSAAGHVLGTGVSLLTASGMSEKQAMAIMNIATKPGGLSKLYKSGMDKKLVDKLSQLFKAKGGVSGKLIGQAQQSSQEQFGD
jgi:hypothetical protein